MIYFFPLEERTLELKGLTTFDERLRLTGGFSGVIGSTVERTVVKVSSSPTEERMIEIVFSVFQIPFFVSKIFECFLKGFFQG